MVVQKAIPLSDNIRKLLFNPLTLNNILSQGRTTKLAWRIRLTSLFLDFVLKYNANHGPTATVKWLKAGLVALQKELGQDRLKSLKVLGSASAYSRTQGGLPRVIPGSERARIRAGDVRTIRFWTGLFNLYRILKVPGVLKLNTITDSFTGDSAHLEFIQSAVKAGGIPLFFTELVGFEKIQTMDLSPKEFVLSRSASPSNKVAATGIFTDVWYLNKYAPELWQEMLYYLHTVNSKVTPFVRSLQDVYALAQQLDKLNKSELPPGVKSGRSMAQTNFFMEKDSLRTHGLGPGKGLSQFAIKEEAAGKIRLFALLDCVSQSIMAPLHLALFALLRKIPNDGTFDQEASVKRGQEKAIKANRAYSFDLTAATDRLPAVLTALLIELIFKLTGLGECWLGVMVGRTFGFNAQVAEKLGVDPNQPIKYAVGQPMGGLSSWAGLAITHHWLVQYAAYLATGKLCWNEDYEILGDDLVIFDKAIADEYLQLMTLIGCEINLSKSINSHNRPVFEFAKRTCWGPNIVSGISMNQVRAGWNVGGRVANALSFSNTGLITKPSLLAIALSRYAWTRKSAASALVFSRKTNTNVKAKLFSLGILSLFGVLYQKGILPLKTLMMSIVNPHYEDADYTGEAVGLPIKASLELGFNALKTNNVPENPFSMMDARKSVYKEYGDELVEITLLSALKKAKVLNESSELLVQKFASSCYFSPVYENGESVPMDDLPSNIKLLFIQIENMMNGFLGLERKGNTPEDLYEKLYRITYDNSTWHHVSFEDATDWLEKVEALEHKLTLAEKTPPSKTVFESAPILGMLRNMDPTRKVRPSYIDPPVFKSLYQLEYTPSPSVS